MIFQAAEKQDPLQDQRPKLVWNGTGTGTTSTSTSLDQSELRSLEQRFYHLAKSSSQKILLLHSNELERLPELAANPLASRIIDFMLSSHREGLSLDAFINFMAVFSPSAGREVKLRLAFGIYDVDGDGKWLLSSLCWSCAENVI